MCQLFQKMNLWKALAAERIIYDHYVCKMEIMAFVEINCGVIIIIKETRIKSYAY